MVAHFDGDVTRANISPRARDRVLERYGPVVSTSSTDGRPLSSVDRVETTGEVLSSVEPVETTTPGPADEALTWRCPGCAYTYDVIVGDEREGFAAGTAWSEIPDTWCCPDCGVRDKVDFVAVERAPAS